MTIYNKKCLECKEDVKQTRKQHTRSLKNKFGGVFCSTSCSTRYRNLSIGEEKITLTCCSCGNVFIRLARIQRKQKKESCTFCSRKCAIKEKSKRDVRGSKNPNFGKGENMRGERHPNWQGGKTLVMRTFRKSSNYKFFRLAVLERDHYKCVQCGSIDNLEVDHIIGVYSDFSKALDVDNGRVLCNPCHRKTDNYASKAWRNK